MFRESRGWRGQVLEQIVVVPGKVEFSLFVHRAFSRGDRMVDLSNIAAHERQVASAREMVTAPQFFKLLRDAVRFRSRPVTLDPLLSAVAQVKLNPAFVQSRLLLRILRALPTQTGEFRRADVSALDAATLELAVDLIDLQAASRSATTDWDRAIEDAAGASA